MLTFLTAAELQTLTGKERPSAQVRWLRLNGYPHDVGGDGKIKVLASFVESRLGGKLSVSTAKERGPDWEAMPVRIGVR